MLSPQLMLFGPWLGCGMGERWRRGTRTRRPWLLALIERSRASTMCVAAGKSPWPPPPLIRVAATPWEGAFRFPGRSSAPFPLARGGQAALAPPPPPVSVVPKSAEGAGIVLEGGDRSSPPGKGTAYGGSCPRGTRKWGREVSGLVWGGGEKTLRPGSRLA